MDKQEQRRIEIERGIAAAQLVDSPLWREAIDARLAQQVEAWSRTKIDQFQEREGIWFIYQATMNLKHDIERIIETGNLSQSQADDEESVKLYRREIGAPEGEE